MLHVEPLTPERWSDFAALCAQMGSNRSCWCLWWRQDGSRPDAPARERARDLVQQSVRPIGLIAYQGEQAVAWAAVGPREDYPHLNSGRDTAPVDGRTEIWVIPCFFVVDGLRRSGVATTLLHAAVAFAAEHGAAAVEGVPVDPATKQRSPAASYTGTTTMFRRAGFAEIARRTPKGRVVMRKELGARA